MFEREINFIYEFNKNKISKLGLYFTFEQLSSLNLHPAIIQYISAEIDYLIFEDRQKLLKNSAFDYSGEKIDHYFNLISDELKSKKRFSVEYIDKLLLHSISFTIHHLVKPNWSLTKFIFENEEHKTLTEINQILHYTYYYGFLKKILLSYLKEKRIVSISINEFGQLLQKIDLIAIKSYLPNLIEIAINAMSSFFNIGTLKKDTIPLEAVAIFLKDKNLKNHLDILNSKFLPESKQNVEVKEIKELLENIQIQDLEDFDNKTEISEDIFEVNEENNPAEQEKTTEIKPSENDDNVSKNAIQSGTDIDEKNDAGQTQVDSTIDDKAKMGNDEEATKIIADEKETQDIKNTIDITDKKEEPEEVLTEESEPSKEEEPLEEDSNENNESKIEEETIAQENDEGNENNEEFTIDFDQPSERTEEDELLNTQSQNDIEFVEEPTGDIENDTDSNVDKNTGEDISEDKPVNDNTDEKKSKTGSIEENNLELFSDDVLSKQDKEPESSNGEKETDENFKELDTELQGKEEIKAQFDISELLENKNMTKIIEVIFNYDMEEFANAIEDLSECKTKEEAFSKLDDIYNNSQIDSSSKEAKTFKSIIEEYFNKI